LSKLLDKIYNIKFDYIIYLEESSEEKTILKSLYNETEFEEVKTKFESFISEMNTKPEFFGPEEDKPDK